MQIINFYGLISKIYTTPQYYKSTRSVWNIKADGLPRVIEGRMTTFSKKNL